MNSSLEPFNQHAGGPSGMHDNTQHSVNASALILKNVPLPNYSANNQIMTIDPSKLKPKPTSDIKKLMVR